MQVRNFIAYGFALVLVTAVGAPGAQEIKLPYRGLTLNAELTLAPGKKLADGVILVTHGALAHNGMELITHLRELFKEQGHNTLAINLSLGESMRKGMFDCKQTHRHRHEDAVGEIGVWLDWLQGQGVTAVTLLGHSRGGAQTALFAAQRDVPMVKAVVLLAPATLDNSGKGYKEASKQPLPAALQKADALIRAGKGGEVLEKVNLLYCRDTTASAESLMSYHGPDLHRDTTYLLPKLKSPVLVVAAGADEIVVGLEKLVAPLADGKRVQLKVIDGADHFFRDLHAEDTVEAVVQFLDGLAG